MSTRKIQGIGEVTTYFQEIEKATKDALGQAMFKGAILVQKSARMSIMKGPKTGQQYGALKDILKVNLKLKGANAAAKRIHQASAPGEAPANDTGNLARSISVLEARLVEGKPTAYVKASAPYAFALEHGTRYIAPRPFMWPAALDNREAIRALGLAAVTKAIKDKKSKP
jgi:HK97 gp10 family phage protein